MFCYFRRAQRRRREANGRHARSALFHRGSRSPTPLDGEYFMIDHESGEGSPRHSGEEADPFLRAHSSPNMRQTTQPTQFGIRNSTVSSNQLTMTSGTNESGYGSLVRDRFDETTPFMLAGRYQPPQQSPNESSDSSRHGRILSPEDQRQISGDSIVLPVSHGHRPVPRFPPPPGSPPPDSPYYSPSAHHTPLLPPPRLVETSRKAPKSPGAPFFDSYNTSSASLDMGEATLLTAQRVRVGSSVESGPQVITTSPTSSDMYEPSLRVPSSRTQTSEPVPTAWSRVTNFFTRQDSTSSFHQSGSEAAATQGSSQLPVPGVMASARRVSDSYTPGDRSRPVSSVINTALFAGGHLPRPSSVAAGDRPISTASSKNSGGTVYHDAREELFSTGSGKGSSHGSGSGKGTPVGGYPGEWGAIASSSLAARHGGARTPNEASRLDPPKLPPGLGSSASPPGAQYTPLDFLDSPPPAALSFFQPLPAVSAPSPAQVRTPFFPPGLNTQRYNGGGLDVLEEEPPQAMPLWQSQYASKRSTFGPGTIDIDPPHLASLRSHEVRPSAAGSSATPHIRTLSPTHVSPAMRMHGGSGSNSGSYSSASAVSVALTRSPSITSDGRRREHNSSNSNSNGHSQGYSSDAYPMSPALSAFGGGTRTSTPARRDHGQSSSDDSAMQPLPPSISGPPLHQIPEMSHSRSGSATIAGPSTAGTNTDSTGRTIALEEFPDVPWAMGLGTDWKAA